MSAYLNESIGFDFIGKRNTVIAAYIAPSCYGVWSSLLQLVNEFLKKYGSLYNGREISFSKLLKLYRVGKDSHKYNKLKNLIFSAFDDLLKVGIIRALISFDNDQRKIAFSSDVALYNAYLGDKKRRLKEF